MDTDSQLSLGWIICGLNWADFQEKIPANIPWGNCQIFHCSEVTAMKNFKISTRNIRSESKRKRSYKNFLWLKYFKMKYQNAEAQNHSSAQVIFRWIYKHFLINKIFHTYLWTKCEKCFFKVIKNADI